MYKVLDKDSIMTEIVAYLPKQVHGPAPRVPIAEIVNAVLYKLKSGVQWNMLPVSELFGGEPLHYKTVFGHYCKWCKAGAWRECWIRLLSDNRSKIDLSSEDFDGSHTTALRWGEQVEYQGRKKRKTTNALYLTDRQGPLAMSEPMAGNHNDLYDIEVHAEEVFATLEDAGIATDGLFVNGDSGFDSEGFRSACAESSAEHTLQRKGKGRRSRRTLRRKAIPGKVLHGTDLRLDGRVQVGPEPIRYGGNKLDGIQFPGLHRNHNQKFNKNTNSR